MATPAAAAQAGADAESLVPVPFTPPAGVTAPTVTFRVHMPQFRFNAFNRYYPFTVDVPADLPTSRQLKENIIGKVRAQSGVDLRPEHACLSDGIAGMPLPDDMPFETLLSIADRTLNLWLNQWTASYRFALRHEAGLTATEPMNTRGVAAPIYTGGVAPPPALMNEPSASDGGPPPAQRRRLQ